MADDFGFFSSSDNGAPPTDDDPAAAFLAQQESEIAGIENDEGFGVLEGAAQLQEEHLPPQSHYDDFGAEAATVNGDVFQGENGQADEEKEEESNGPTDGYSAIAHADQLRQEPESLRKWREEQKARLEELDSASKVAEAEWRERAKKELEDWHLHQSEQMEKNKANNRASEEASLNDGDEDAPGSEWERVAQLCDFNPKTSKQSKDVSRMRSILISLKQTPLVR